jgi:hypothetical protein
MSSYDDQNGGTATLSTVSIPSDTRLETIERTIVLRGIRDILFDRYPGDNNTQLAWAEKVYLIPGTDILCLPVENIHSFFCAHNTESATKRLRDPRKYKKICGAISSFCMFSGPPEYPEFCPFTRDGDVIRVGAFGEHTEEQSGIFLDRRVARLEKGIPNPKERPRLPLPWGLEWRLTILKNSEIKEAEIRNICIEGGIAVGFGTFRGQFGKFLVESWG